MKAISCVLLCIILLTQVYALETQTENQTSDITLVDVSSDGESCIFNVYGKTVVVDKRDTVTTNGVTIYVQEVYPVNTEAQNTDRCKFMYSGAITKTEDPINKITVGESIIHFLLGKRKDAEIQQTELTPVETNTENIPKEATEETTVKVNGYDVTKTQEVQETITISEEPKTFFQKITRFLFG
ncbi:MAG: hypothetical protein WC254_00345 [Candidatus Woesearchaeota archaeon]|jgi:hypothetical protein